MTLENNVVETSDIPNFLHSASNITVINAGTNNVYDYTPAANTYIENGTLDAAAVMANAGIEPAYQDILITDR